MHIYIHIYIYIHTYIHYTYIHTFIHTFIHIHTYLPTYIHTCMNKDSDPFPLDVMSRAKGVLSKQGPSVSLRHPGLLLSPSPTQIEVLLVLYEVLQPVQELEMHQCSKLAAAVLQQQARAQLFRASGNGPWNVWSDLCFLYPASRPVLLVVAAEARARASAWTLFSAFQLHNESDRASGRF